MLGISDLKRRKIVLSGLYHMYEWPHYLICVMRKPDFCLCENKDTDQLCSNCTADQRLCFRYLDSTIPPLQFQDSYFLLRLYRLVCVRPGRKPQIPVFHEDVNRISPRSGYPNPHKKNG